MMAQIARMTMIVEGMTNKTPSSALLMRVADSYVTHWQSDFDKEVADPANPTNDEKAGFFIMQMKKFGKVVLRAEAERAARVDAQSGITQAGDEAVIDLD